MPPLPVRSTGLALRFRSPHTSGTIRLGRIGSLLLLFSILLLPAAASGAPHDGGPKVLLHAMAVSQKNVCARGALADCRDAAIAGTVGVPHYVYLLGAPGIGTTLSAVEVGITYQDGEPNDRLDGAGIDIFSWTRCATLDFLSPAPRPWPGPAGGNVIVFDATLACQEGETAVFGYFYLTAYAPDALHLMARPQSGRASVADCASVETALDASDLGAVRFSHSGGEPGCNPCVAPCPAAPELAPALCEISMTGTDFGRVTVGSTRYTTRHVTIRNTGQQILVGQMSLDSPHFSLWGGPADYALAPYEQTTRGISFRPVEPGVHTAELTGGAGCPSFTLTGEGRLHFGCSFSPLEATLSGIPTGTAAVRTFVLTNEGAEEIAGTVTLEPVGGPFQLLVEPEFVLAPNASKDYVVQFRSDVEGQFTVRLRAGTCIGAQLNAITAGALLPPECWVSDTLLDFGTVPVGWVDFLRVRAENIGGGTLLTDVTFEGAAFHHDGHNGPVALRQWEARPATIEFGPPEPGSYEGWLDFGADCPPVRLVGVGRAPGAGVLEPAALDFGVVLPGDVAERPFTVTNQGTDRIQGTLTSNRPEFSLVGATTYSLAPGESAAFQVSFQSSNVGEFRGAVDAGEGSGFLPVLALSDIPSPIRSTTWSALKSRFGGH